jgi:hypothetical protein
VANLFAEWFEHTSKMIENFSLLPYDKDDGEQIADINQISQDPPFVLEYYFNHCILQHRNLTGMVCFQTNVPWYTVKSLKKPYFQWLKHHKVSLNFTKFKTDTLVACGFLVGAHPGYLCQNEVQEKLKISVGIEDTIPFQLSS